MLKREKVGKPIFYLLLTYQFEASYLIEKNDLCSSLLVHQANNWILFASQTVDRILLKKSKVRTKRLFQRVAKSYSKNRIFFVFYYFGFFNDKRCWLNYFHFTQSTSRQDLIWPLKVVMIKIAWNEKRTSQFWRLFWKQQNKFFLFSFVSF